MGEHFAVCIRSSALAATALCCWLCSTCAVPVIDTTTSNAPNILHIESPETLVSTGSALYMLEDNSGMLSIDDILTPQWQKQFQPCNGSIPFTFPTTSALWVRCTFVNSTPAQMFAYLRDPILDTVIAYMPTGTGMYIRRSGNVVPNARDLDVLFFTFALPTQAVFQLDSVQPASPQLATSQVTPSKHPRPQTLYIRISGTAFLTAPLYIGSQTACLRADRLHIAFVLAAVGFVAAMALYNLFIAFIVRTPEYFWYGLYNFTMTFLMCYDQGALPVIIGYELFSHIATHISLLALSPFTLAIAFAMTFLETRRHAPLAHRSLQGALVLVILLCILSLIGFIRLSNMLIPFTMGTMALTMIGSGIATYRRGYKPARFFLLSWTVWLLFLVVYSTVLPLQLGFRYPVVFSLGIIGVPIELLFMAFALADRIKTLQRERSEARALVMQALEENHRLAVEQNRELERKVRERTESLEERNHELDAMMHEINRANQDILHINNQLAEQNEQLTLLNAEKNELLGLVSHDLKNPLNSIMGMADLLRSQQLHLSQEEQRQFACRIYETGETMLTLIHRLLEDNATELGSITLQQEPLQPALWITDVISAHLPAAQAKGINIYEHGENADALIIIADKVLLRQVLDNLLSNAIKYSPLGKNITVRVRQHHTQNASESVVQSTALSYVSSHSLYLRIEISDEGPGLSEEDKANLFKKFTRLSARPTAGEHSTGLGLSIVKKLVELMQGKVWCESTYGQGATFIVEFPAYPITTSESTNTQNDSHPFNACDNMEAA